MCVCTPLILTVSPNSVNLQNISDPWSGYGCCGGAWGRKKIATNIFWTNQKSSHHFQTHSNFQIMQNNHFQRNTDQRGQNETSLTGQRGQRGWRRHSLECVWSCWGPASWPAGTAGSLVPPLGFLLRSCHPTTGASERKLLWRPKPEPQTAS